MDYLGTVDSYTDFSGLGDLKRKGKEGDKDAIREVARQFESLFVHQLLKSMRQANEIFSEGSFLSSNETKSYEQMFDNQLSLSMTKGRGIGLADSIVRQLSSAGQGDEQSKAEQLKEIDMPLQQGFSIDTARKLSSIIHLNEQQLTVTSHPDKSNLLDKSTELVTPVTQVLTIPTTPDEFIHWVYPEAVEVAKELGVSPKILVAQSALETGWGQKPIRTAEGGNSHNLFGIKADHRWSGQKTSVGTLEYREGIAQKEQASFRVYDSIKDSLQDYVQFLKQSPRYQQALESVSDPSSFAHSLMNSGYATDPKYAEKIMGIFDGKLLNRVVESMKIGSMK
ncbi:MAG: flagellar assembly peptidoglycan hydrolase FlgJ [Pseudomonadales bacterium]|nr:flagellar assembly peptidoglycan hydrolase FlgJ [Pseudomonadales bacterium]